METIKNENEKKEVVEVVEPSAEKLNEGEVSKATNTPETNPIDEVPVDALEDETMKISEQEKKDLTDALESTEPEADGRTGVQVVKKGANYAHAGMDKAVVTAASVRGARPIAGDTELSFVDIDPEEKNAARVQHTIDHIGADIVKEGTPGVAEDYINPREESNVAIERETMDSVQRAVGMCGSIKAPSAGGSTQAGNVFRSTNGLMDVTDHMYHTGVLSKSQFSEKKLDVMNGIVLNEYDASGQIIKDKRRFIPLRHVAIVGMDCNPIAINFEAGANRSAEEPFVTIGVKQVQTGYDWATGDPVTSEVQVRMPAQNAHKLFKTIDLTALTAGVKAATQELLLNATSLDERAKLGEIEAIVDGLMNEDTAIAAEAVIPSDVELHPNYKRCSLYEVDPNAFDDKVDLSCGNNIASVANFIKALNKSEIVWGKFRFPFAQNETDLFNGYKMRKNFAGKDESMNYYNATLKANILSEHADAQKVPGLNTFCAYINSNPYGRYETKGNLLYRFGDLKRKIRDYIDEFAKNKKLASVLTKAYTDLSAVESASNVFQTGKLAQNGSLDILGKIGGTATIILPFDPNDLLSYQKTGTLVKAPAVEAVEGSSAEPEFANAVDQYLVHPFIAVGYRNSFRVDSTKINGLDQKDYLLAPTWLAAICDIFTEDNAVQLNKLYTAHVSRDRFKVKSELELISDAYKKYKICTNAGSTMPRSTKADAFYQPMIVNPDHPEWIDFFVNEMLWVVGVNEYLTGLKDNRDGYLHLMEVFSKDVNGNSFKSFIEDGGITVADAIAKIISNPLNYCNPAYRKVSDMTPVTDEAAKILNARHSDHQTAILESQSYTFSFGLPDSRDFDVDDMAGYELIPGFETGNTPITADDVEDKKKILMNCRTVVSGSANAAQKLVLVSIGENEFIVCYQKAGKVNEVDRATVAPVLFRKTMLSEDEAKYAKKRYVILADGADSIDHFGEDIGSALYGHDGFYFNENCDGYALKINKHETCTAGVAGSDSKIYKASHLPESEWTMSIVPVKMFKATTRVSESYNSNLTSNDIMLDYAVDQPVYTIPFLSMVKQPIKGVNGNNKLYTVAKASIYAPLNLLSMYSGKRLGACTLANYAATEAGWKFGYSYADLVEGLEEPTASSRISEMTVFNYIAPTGVGAQVVTGAESIISGKPYVRESYYRGALEMQFEIFAPNTAYAVDTSTVLGQIGTHGQSNDLSNDDFLRMFDAGNLDITIPTYWDRQYYRCTNAAGKQLRTNPDRDNSADIADATIILAGLNVAICPEVYTNIDSGSLEGASHPYGDSNFFIFKTPGNHLKVEMLPMINEAFDQFADGRYILPIPARYFFACAIKRTLTVDDYGVMATMPNNLAVNPVVFARYYRRDHCDYIAYKPLVTLNKNWTKKYNINRKLSDTFYHKAA